MGCDGPSCPGTAARPAGCAHPVKVMEHKAPHVAQRSAAARSFRSSRSFCPALCTPPLRFLPLRERGPEEGELPGIRGSSHTAAQRIRCAALSATSPLTRGDFGFPTDCRGWTGRVPGRPNSRSGAGQNGARILKARRICPSMGSEYCSVA